MQKQIVAIGDIHGLREWRNIVDSNPGSRFVFLGDYCDPYDDIDTQDIIANLKDIISLKKAHPKDVILLLGNHDMHYVCDIAKHGTRYDETIAQTLKDIFKKNIHLFQYAYQIGNTVFTHAGICEKWFTEQFKGDRTRNIADQLNNPSEEQLEAMCHIGMYRGGIYDKGGIFWADRVETENDAMRGIHQVVGHTRCWVVIEYDFDDTTHITYCDCLQHGLYYKHQF